MNVDGKDLPSSSDESDVDFVPKEDDLKSDSGSEESDYESSDGGDESNKTRKRKKHSKKSSKKIKSNQNEGDEKEEDSESKEEEKKIDVDALWEDFKKDVNNKDYKKTAESSNVKTEGASIMKTNESTQSSNQKNTTNVRPKGIVNLPNKNKGGLSSILSQIGKKDKMSTLQKSQLDWNKFKKSEGIEEEIKLHNKGKDGYLDKQDFLQRTDLRQFEIEKDLRSARRKF